MLVKCKFGVDLGLGVSRVVVLCRWLLLLPVPFAGAVAWGVPWSGGVASNVWCLSVRCVWSVRVLPSGLAAVV